MVRLGLGDNGYRRNRELWDCQSRVVRLRRGAADRVESSGSECEETDDDTGVVTDGRKDEPIINWVSWGDRREDRH